MLRSVSKVKLCGAIFDAPGKLRELSKTEAEVNDPNFWNQPEKSQRVMQQRKRLEEAIQNSNAVASPTSDIETLFELGREGENVVPDLERELKDVCRQAGEPRNRHAAFRRKRRRATRL